MMEFHHIGVAYASLEKAYKECLPFAPQTYESLAPKIFHVASQKVNVCFIPLGTRGTGFFELIEPTGEGSQVANFLRRNIRYYHTGFLTVDLDSTVIELQNMGFKLLEIFPSEPFDHARCAFLVSATGTLFELIEKPDLVQGR